MFFSVLPKLHQLKNTLYFLFIVFTLSLNAQKNKQQEAKLHFIKQARLEGEFRNFFMHTNNNESLSDYYTNASGLKLKLNSGRWKGLDLAVGGSYITKTFSSVIAKKDQETGQFTKWEYELHDVLNRDNFNFFLLEEFYLNYQSKKTSIRLGNMLVETPMFSTSDGRMRPFIYRGLNTAYAINSKHQIKFWWLTHTLVRSTTNWFNNNEAIGLITNGFQPNGQVADYQNQYNSRGSGIFNYNFQHNQWYIDYYQFHLDDIMTMSFAKIRKTLGKFNLGMQYTYQHPLKTNRKLAYVHRYIQPDERPQVISTRIRYANSTYSITGAYSYSLATGRMLFPKELGRDWYYTSTARSRMEGLGDAHNFLLKGEYFIPKSKLYFAVEYIQMLGPEIDNFHLNKYNIDEYWQVNARVRYDANFLKGVNFDLLYVFKENLNNNDPINVFNRSDYNQFNLVTNIYF